MTSKPLISVVMPAYNSEKTICCSIQSVLAQTYQNLELIVIDDGSTDRTSEIVALMADPRIQLFSYPNQGASSSRNRGIAKAAGDYLAFIDGDDLWVADKLEAQLQALLDTPEAAVTYSWTDYIDENDRVVHPGYHRTVNGRVYRELLLQNFIENGSNVLIRRQALEVVGGFDPSLRCSEDWDLWLRLAERYEFVAVSRPQVLYRISPGSLSSHLQWTEATILQVLDRHLARAPEIVRPIRRSILADYYQYLVHRSLQGPLEKQRALAAMRCLYLGFWYHPAQFRKKGKWLVASLLKIMLAILLPPTWAGTILDRLRRMNKHLELHQGSSRVSS